MSGRFALLGCFDVASSCETLTGQVFQDLNIDCVLILESSGAISDYSRSKCADITPDAILGSNSNIKAILKCMETPIKKTGRSWHHLTSIKWVRRNIYIGRTPRLGHINTWYRLCEMGTFFVCFARCLTHLLLGQNGRRFADDIFRSIFMNEKFCILIKSSLKFAPMGPIDKNPAVI